MVVVVVFGVVFDDFIFARVMQFLMATKRYYFGWSVVWSVGRLVGPSVNLFVSKSVSPSVRPSVSQSIR